MDAYTIASCGDRSKLACHSAARWRTLRPKGSTSPTDKRSRFICSIPLISYWSLATSRLTISWEAAARSAKGLLRASWANSLKTRSRRLSLSRRLRVRVSCGSTRQYAGSRRTIDPARANSTSFSHEGDSCCSSASSRTKFVSTNTFTRRCLIQPGRLQLPPAIPSRRINVALRAPTLARNHARRHQAMRRR